MPFHAIIGGQRGDEGKGRFVDLVAGEYDIIARGNGGANAGHTIVIEEGKEPLALHQVPSGIAYPGKINVVGNGVYVDPVRLLSEIRDVQAAGLTVTTHNLLISDAAHLVFPHHILLDTLRESGKGAQGSTKSGIAYVAADKYLREGVRLESVKNPNEIYDRAYQGLVDVNRRLPKADQHGDAQLSQIADDYVASVQQLRPHLSDTVAFLNQRLNEGALILGEGAQAFWLDVNQGMYPMVTSSSTTVTGLLDGLGIAPKHVEKVTVVAKAVKSHVGGGPLVTEIEDDKLAATIRGDQGAADSEFGATTKRPRRIGYPDLVELRTAVEVNGADEVVLSKVDHIPRYGHHLQAATSYTYDGAERATAPASAAALAECQPVYRKLDNWKEDVSPVRKFDDLPKAAQEFVELFESELKVKVSKVGVGPGRNQVIIR